MGDPQPRADDLLQQIRDEFQRFRESIRDALTPSGTQQFNAVPKLQQQIEELTQTQQGLSDAQQALVIAQGQLEALVNDIDATLTEFIANDVAAIVDAAITARLAAADITIGQAGGTVHIPALYTTNVIPTGQPRTVVWVTEDGLVGHT